MLFARFSFQFQYVCICISFVQIYRHIGNNSPGTSLLIQIWHTKTASHFICFGSHLLAISSSYIYACLFLRIRVFLLRESSEYILHINKFIRYSWRQQTHGTPVLLYLSSNQKVTISLREEWLLCEKICERTHAHTWYAATVQTKLSTFCRTSSYSFVVSFFSVVLEIFGSDTHCFCLDGTILSSVFFSLVAFSVSNQIDLVLYQRIQIR